MTHENGKALFGLTVPLQCINVLVPSIAIAEVITSIVPQRTQINTPWCIGQWIWHEQNIPLVSFEMANGNTFQSLDIYKVVAVFNTLTQDPRLPYMALPVSGVPHLNKLLPGDIMTLDKESGSMSKACIQIKKTEVYIPNLALLEQQLLDAIEE